MPVVMVCPETSEGQVGSHLHSTPASLTREK